MPLIDSWQWRQRQEIWIDGMTAWRERKKNWAQESADRDMQAINSEMVENCTVLTKRTFQGIMQLNSKLASWGAHHTDFSSIFHETVQLCVKCKQIELHISQLCYSIPNIYKTIQICTFLRYRLTGPSSIITALRSALLHSGVHSCILSSCSNHSSAAMTSAGKTGQSHLRT